MRGKKAFRELPEGYQLKKELDLASDLPAKIVLSLVSLVLFFLFWLLFIWLLKIFRPGLTNLESSFSITGEDLRLFPLQLTILLAITFGMVFLHEGIHGLFFWLFTKEKPRFGFKVVYAYAGAPCWYITKWPYLIVGIAPLVLITVIGFIFLLIVPAGWLLLGLLFITMNAAGAVGDIYALFWLLREPGNILVEDSGERVRIFGD